MHGKLQACLHWRFLVILGSLDTASLPVSGLSRNTVKQIQALSTHGAAHVFSRQTLQAAFCGSSYYRSLMDWLNASICLLQECQN